MTKKILFITPYNLFPPYWGGGTRTYNMVKHLSRNYDVDLILPSYEQFKNIDGDEYLVNLRELGTDIEIVGPPTSWVQYINPLIFLKSLKKFFLKDIDLIICDYPWSGLYTLGLHKLTNTPYFLMEHNVEYEVTKQTGYENPVLTKKLEKKVADNAEKIFCVSEKDRYKLESGLDIDRSKLEVLKNGFNADVFNTRCDKHNGVREELGIGDDPVIFFCGKMDYIPNTEAVDFIYHEVMPRVLKEVPETKFLVVGGGYEFDYEHESLIMTGVVEDVSRYLKASDFVVIPLKRGGGTRIKALEAIACGKDIVSTSKGVEGLVNDYTKPFIDIADDWDKFSQILIDKIKDYEDPIPDEEFFEEYSWDNIFSQMDKYIEQF